MPNKPKGKTKSKIKNKKSIRTSWSTEEDEFLKDNYDKMSNQELADKLNRPLGATYFRRHKLRSVHEASKPFTDEELKIIKSWYEKHTTRKSLNLNELVKLLGNKRCKSSICRRAFAMGLTKKWSRRKRKRKRIRKVVEYDEEE